MPPPAELDVFRIPHCRMKHLMNEIITKMTDTDFSNAVHLQALLGFVDDHFEVFQSHEQIENTYILKSLVERISPERMKPLDNDIHSDHTLTKLRTLIGELKLRLVADESEIVECGNTLKTAVQQFAVDFFPHMEEEESVFQPLLMEYFTREELKTLKLTILRLHSLPNNSPSQEELLVEKWNNSFSLCQEHIRDLVVSDLPDELWLKIYSYLNPRDLCRCARVCKVWAGLSRDMSLWHSIWPTRWARGNWSFNKPEEEEEEEEEDIWDSSLCCVQGNSSMGWGSKGGKDSSEFDVEHRVFMGVVKHLLPIVGMSVKRVGMAHSRVLTNALMMQVFRLCPDVEYLNVSYTRISDKAFSGLESRSHRLCLTHLDLSGCSSITDRAMDYLGSGLSRLPSSPCGDCDCECLRVKQKQKARGRLSLVSLSLSGCYQVTDEGLSVLAGGGGLPKLQHLDLSGCMNVSGVVLTNLTNTCSSLNHEEFFYCDNIMDGPYQDTASGCRNVGSACRVCCRMDY